MKHGSFKWIVLTLALMAIMLAGACKKKVAPPPPPPPPPPTAPTASITASPTSVDKGGTVTLTWQTANATDVSIDGVGAVQASGTQTVTPADSTTYTLTAKGPGGTQTATTRVTVNAPAPPPVNNNTTSATEEEMFAQSVKDIYFDYDKYDVRADQQSALQADVAFLQAHPNIKFTIEGHCDSRGSTEYNLALGQNRADSVKNALVSGGVSTANVNSTSLGKEKPFCTEENEQCWQMNRVVHFAYQK